MELGLNFDDAFYEASTKQEKPPPTSYNAKFCSLLWFEDEVSTQGCEDELQLLKFSGDYNLGQKKYEVALEKYEQAIKLLPEHNNSMYQDMMESIARCHLNLGNPDMAVTTANKLYLKAVIPSHRTRHLVLLQHIYSTCGHIEGHKTVLQKLLLLHPTNVHYWIALASCYSEAGCSSSSCISEEFSNLVISSPDYCKQLTCLIRARCLLKYSMKTTSSFVKKKHEVLFAEVESEIDLLNPEDSLVTKITEFITQDLGTQTELQDTDGETMEETEPKTQAEDEKDFEFLWFSWNKTRKHVHKTKTSNLSDVIK